MWFLGRGWGRLGLGKSCRPWVPRSRRVGLTLTSEQKVYPLPGDLTEGLGRFQPHLWRVSGSIGQPSLPGAWPTGHSRPGRWGGTVPCPGPTPALPVGAAGLALWTREAGSGQEPGRGPSGGVQTLLSGRQTHFGDHPCSQRPPPHTQG